MATKLKKGVASQEFDRTLEVYPDKGGRFRWRAVASNGRITATSNEDFSKAGNAERAAHRESDAWNGIVRVIRTES